MKVTMIPVSAVKIKYDRMREDLGDLSALVESIRTFGQLQPIIVEDDMSLVDGYRRWTAHQKLERTEIAAVLRSDVDETLHRELELETNIQRLDMSWQERAKAIAMLDQLKRERNPNWGQAQTAAAAGVYQREVSTSKSVTELMKLFPEIAEAKSLTQAMNIAKQKVKQVVQRKAVENKEVDYSAIEAKIGLGDSVEWIKTLPDGIINAVITDPPFGVNYHSRLSTTVAGNTNEYVDTKESYEHILTMLPDVYRVIKPNGWVIWFAGMSWYQRLVDELEAVGFTVDPIPVIWDRTEGRAFTNRPDLYFGKGYDIAIHAFKGNPVLAQQNKANIIKVAPVPSNDRDLLVERPVELYAELIRRLTIPGELVADFFVGSGSCPAAAAMLGRDFIGCELNPERRAFALKKILAHMPETRNG